MKKKLVSMLLLVLFNFTVFSPYALAKSSGEEYRFFKDVLDDYWAAMPINNLAYFDIIQGYSNDIFKPNDYVTREQFAVLMFKALKMEFPLRIKQPSFTDVGEKRWSYPYIETVKDYMEGYPASGGKKNFRPAANATRQDVAVAVVKALKYTPSELTNKNILKDKFIDYARISTDKQPYIALAVEKKLISGFPDGTIQAGIPVTRAQTAAILNNVIAPDYEQELGPMLTVKIPERVTDKNVTITGTTVPGATVFINGKSVKVTNGGFSATYILEKEGDYEYEITAQVPGIKKETIIKRVVRFEYPTPVLTFDALPKIASTKNITVSGKVVGNGSSVNLYINNKPVYLTPNGIFKTAVTLNGGENMLDFVATNNFGKSVKETKVVYFDDGGPALYVESTPESTSNQKLRILGQITDKNDPYPQLYFNNKIVQQWEDGTFEVVTLLNKGVNTLTFKAVDRHGKTSTVVRTVTFNNQLPVLTLDAIPEVVSSTRLTISGRASDINDSNPKLYLNNKVIAVNQDGTFKTTVDLKKGDNVLNFSLVNKLGDTTVLEKKVTMAYPPSIKFDTSIPTQRTDRTLTIMGTVTDVNGVECSLYFNDVKQTLASNGRFRINVTLKDGENELVFTAVNKYGVSTTITVKVTYNKPV